jgi:hypothetical protein
MAASGLQQVSHHGDVTLSPEELALDLVIQQMKPRVVVLMSGKRKSGKDYIASRLLAG